MLYTFDTTKLTKRFLPTALRRPRMLAWARVLVSWLAKMHQDFLAWRTEAVLAEYRFNGLIHSLERMLNMHYDALLNRIYITVVQQYPVLYHADDGQLAGTAMATEGNLTGYYYLPDGAVPQPYLYEFLVHVPASISFNAQGMFERLDLYRYAGRRPAIRRYAPDDSTVEIILYPGLSLPANTPPSTTIDPQYEDG